MVGAKRPSTKHDLRKMLARTWAASVFPQHVDRALADQRLPQRDYVEKRRIRKGNSVQCIGTPTLVSTMLALYT